MIGRTTEVIDSGTGPVSIYATNMLSEQFAIDPSLSKEERKIAIQEKIDAYEEKRKKEATKQGVLLDETSMQETTMVQLLDGFKIFLGYECEDGASAWEHDVIFAGKVNPEDLKPGHAEKLENLGWSWNDEYECWEHF